MTTNLVIDHETLLEIDETLYDAEELRAMQEDGIFTETPNLPVPVEDTALANPLSGVSALLRSDPNILKSETVQVAADVVFALGAQEMAYLGKINLPEPKEGETQAEWFARIEQFLTPKERAEIDDKGLKKMLTLQRFAEVGVEARFLAAYESGSYLNSEHVEDAEEGDKWGTWVRTVIQSDYDMSATTATRYTHSIPLITFVTENRSALDVHDEEGNNVVPEDAYAWFTTDLSKRAGRLGAVGSEVIAKIRTTTGDEKKEWTGKLEESLRLILDKSVPQKKIDAAVRQSAPRVSPIVVREQSWDPDTGDRVAHMSMTGAQYDKLMRLAGDAIEYVVAGELPPEYRRMRVRIMRIPVCIAHNDTPLSLILAEGYPEFACPVCGQGHEVNDDEFPTPEFVEWVDYTELHDGQWGIMADDGFSPGWHPLPQRPEFDDDDTYPVVATEQTFFGVDMITYELTRHEDWIAQIGQ